MYTVHMFKAEATASNATHGANRPGDRHAMIAFIRQPSGTDHDWSAAEAGIIQAGWSSVVVERAGTLDLETLNGRDPEFRAAVEHALVGGCGLVVYSEPIPEADG